MPLTDQLSNFGRPLLRLAKGLEAAGGLTNLQVEAGAVQAEIIAQSGAEDPASVRLEAKENRKLSAVEIAEVAASYQSGATLRSLAIKFGMHQQTVRAHLRRQGVALRPVRVLTESEELDAVRLYVEETWTLAELAAKFSVSPSTVRNALSRRGVKMRAKARRVNRPKRSAGDTD